MLYGKTDISPDHIYYLEPTPPDIDEHCNKYESLIRDKGGLTLSILGIGMNGHVGFNEPGSKETDRTRVVHLDERTKEVSWKYGFDVPPSWGVTVGIATLLESREILMLANGELKAEIVRQVVYGEKTVAVPASLLRDHPNCTLLLDSGAASLL